MQLIQNGAISVFLSEFYFMIIIQVWVPALNEKRPSFSHREGDPAPYVRRWRRNALRTSFPVLEYSFTFSTATILVSTSEDILTSQVRDVVSCIQRQTEVRIGSSSPDTGKC